MKEFCSILSRKKIQFAPKLLRLIASLVVSVVCTLLFMALPRIPFLKPWLGLIADSTQEWYMNAYYGAVNTTTDAMRNPDILILDITEKITRKDLADLIMFVSKCNPRSVGLDYDFANTDNYDSIQTHALIDSLSKLPAAFPISVAFYGNESSVLPDSVMRNKGVVEFSGFYKFKSYYENNPHFAIELTRLAGYDVNRLDTSTFIVNYRKKQFTSILIYRDFLSLSNNLKDKINGKIVLIGALNNRFDIRHVPFLIDNPIDYRMAGTLHIAYILSSVITAASTASYGNNRIFHYYSRSSWGENLLLVLVLMLCYLWIYVFIDKRQEKYQWLAILKPILLFIMLVLMMGALMVYTAYCYRVPNVAFFMVMTVFMGPSYEMFKYIKRN